MMSLRTTRQLAWHLFAAILLLAFAGTASAELVMRLLIVNPSDTQVREFDIKSPLPPEVKPEHVLDADGLKVDYDSQAGVYVLIGKVTLKPKESVTKRILLEDVWFIEPERLTAIRRETQDVQRKLEETAYAERGRTLAQSIERRLSEIEEHQEGQPFLSPVQHITLYRNNVKTLEQVEVDLISMRQLMVMAALNPPQPVAAPLLAPAEPGGSSGQSGGGLPLATAWKIIFMILGVIGFISLSFFVMWQRQVKSQLAKQAAANASEPSGGSGGNGRPASSSSTASEAHPGQT